MPIANNVSLSELETRNNARPDMPSRMTWGSVVGSSKFRTTSETVGGAGAPSESLIKSGDCTRPVKSDVCPGTMAKRLTKALREKRRWIGLDVGNCESRSHVESTIKGLAPVEDWKLMDFTEGKAIIRILLKHQNEWREVLQDTNSPIQSLTMSGKIRLVRERLKITK